MPAATASFLENLRKPPIVMKTHANLSSGPHVAAYHGQWHRLHYLMSLAAVVLPREMGIRIGFLGGGSEITHVSICRYAWHRASAQKKRYSFLIFGDYLFPLLQEDM